MGAQTKPETVIKWVKRSITLTNCWPLPINSTDNQEVLHKIFMFLSAIHATTLLLPLLNTSFNLSNELKVIVISASLACVIMSAILQILTCAVYSKELQSIVLEMEIFCKRRESYVQDILCDFIEKRAKYYGMYMLFGYFTAVLFVVGPFFLSQDFPTYGEYPFATNGTFIKPLVYFGQSSVAFQCAGHVCIDGFVGLLVWFAAARFEILAVEFQRVTNSDEILECIKRHQAAMSYAEQLIPIIRFLILAEILSGAVRIVLSSLSFIIPQSGVEIVQSMTLSCIALIGAFLCIWPADYLMDVNEAILQGVYASKWYNSADTRKEVLFILMRCQKQMAISAGVVLPAANLPYFRAYVSTAVSYFTFLRIMLHVDEK